MAIDSAAKRASALNFSSEDLLPIPDSTIDQGDRQTLLGLYRGILSGELIRAAQAMMSRLLLLRHD